MSDTQAKAAAENDPPESKPIVCSCIQDPFAALPPELRPRAEPKMGGLRKVVCPGCGKTYWTNRASDLCIECEKKSGHPSGTGTTHQET